mmetsp:Transcript_26363/g.47320  ORF Transcript_26363/g.47320 Transcript_26363/m.47320 type:complete len:109 (+) Transcript_26363:295-621(+)
MRFSSTEAVIYRDVWNMKTNAIELAGENGNSKFDMFDITWSGVGVPVTLKYVPHREMSKQVLLYSTVPQVYQCDHPLKHRYVGFSLQYSLSQGQVTVAFSPGRKLGFE